jgi:hypothetical protein
LPNRGLPVHPGTDASYCLPALARPVRGEGTPAQIPLCHVYPKGTQAVDAAAPGDTYYFNDIKVCCPGDQGPARQMNSMIFDIQ